MRKHYLFGLLILLAACGEATKSSTFKLHIGEEGRIICPSESTLAAKDKPSLIGMIESNYANDDYANKERFITGAIFYIEKNTRVLILDYDHGLGQAIYQIRILDGREKNRKAFVFAKSVQ